jgi:hypothetical protein
MTKTKSLFIVCLIVVLMIASGTTASAQVVSAGRNGNVTPSSDIFGLGLSGGPSSGLGLSFRQHLASPFSYQIVGGIIKATDRLYYSLGAQMEFDMSRGSAVRFYGALGFAYFYSGVDGHNDMSGPSRLGFGIGMEAGLSSGLNIKGELLFTYLSDGVVLPLPAIGFHYYFI